MKYDIWSPAEEKMHELYGESIPALISQHYQREKLLIQDLGMEKQLAFFGILQHAAMN